MMSRRKQAIAQVRAEPATVFARLDDQTRLGEHMEKPSLMMGGGRMTYAFDAQKGRAVGSHIRMGGSAFGLTLSLDQVVTERVPPQRKVWRTVGQPKLIVVGDYEMGFELSPVAGGAALKVWIDYDLPRAGIGRLLPGLGDGYAQWCVDQMVADAVGAFGRLDTAAAVKA
jgi:hypothetical protein